MSESFYNKLSLKFKPDFFEEEVRCEYLITEKSKKIMAVQLDLLHQLDDVCKKYNIQYFAYCGTLLGAVRHKGFIPWDDDIDVCMTRPEFERFLQIASLEFRHPYFLQTALSDREYFFAYARLRNSLTTGYITEYSEGEYNQGIYIDIFVLDGYIEDEKKFKNQNRYKNLLLRVARYYRDNYVKKSLSRKFLSSVIRKLLPYEQFVKVYNKNLSKYNNTTERLSLVTHTASLTRKYHCLKSELNSQIYLDFENIKVPVPVEYKSILTNMYGDYMKYPPIEKRGVWHSGQLFFDPDIPYVDYVKQLRKKNSIA